ncbi:MAG: hypothetical protein ACKVOH_00005, partial [Chlamydiales bacterium]
SLILKELSEMIWQFFAKIIAEGAIIEQKNARAARQLLEDEGEQPKTQVISYESCGTVASKKRKG